MLEISEGLLKKIKTFKTSQAVSLSADEGAELKHYYQQTYSHSIDLGCNGCVGRSLRRIIQDLEI